MNSAYTATVRQLLDIAPVVFTTPHFAIKGGTALNLFLHDLRRLSVDIDVVFTNHSLGREAALQAIATELGTIRQKLEAMDYEVRQRRNSSGNESKLMVIGPLAEVKVEVNEVFRGTLLPLQQRPLSPATGKLVAAMDRQHPRDLFDVMQLFAHEGITANIRRAFVVYLASHNRPVHEVLFPTLRDIGQEYERNFIGMTTEPVELAALLTTRERMVQELQSGLDAQERRFLRSLVANKPEWSLLGIAHLDQLPGIRWKLHNLGQLELKNPKKFAEQAEALAKRLG